MEKTALFAFNGDPVCFIHVLLNALDLNKQGHQVAVVLEGASTGLIPDLASGNSPLAKLYQQVKEQDLIHAVCKACAQKTGGLEAAKAEGLPLGEDMSGHPSMGAYLADGFRIITF